MRVLNCGINLLCDVLAYWVRFEVDDFGILITEAELHRDLGQCTRRPIRIFVLGTEGKYSETRETTYH